MNGYGDNLHSWLGSVPARSGLVRPSHRLDGFNGLDRHPPQLGHPLVPPRSLVLARRVDSPRNHPHADFPIAAGDL